MRLERHGTSEIRFALLGRRGWEGHSGGQASSQVGTLTQSSKVCRAISGAARQPNETARRSHSPTGTAEPADHRALLF